MRKIFVLPLLFAALLPGQDGGSVQGNVVNPNSGEPVAGAEIVLYTRQALHYETTSDTAGGFQFSDIKPGDYEIRFEKEGYSIGRRLPAQPYRIAPGQPAIHIRLEMSRRAALSGRVVDIEGKPVRAQVIFTNEPAVATTDSGDFAIRDVEPGVYTLLAIPETEAVRKDVKDEVRVERIPTYYPAASDSAGAQKIVVRGDTDITGLEIRMQTAEVHRVRGVVLDDNGSPAPNANVTLAPLGMLPGRVTGSSQSSEGVYLTLLGPQRGPGALEAKTTTDSNGVFEFPFVREGDWQIAAIIPGTQSANSAPIALGAVAALVAHEDIQGVRIQRGSPFALTTTIDWGDLPKRAGRVSLIPTDGPATGMGFVMPNAGLPLRAVPGRYYISPWVSAGYYADSVKLGGRDVMGQAVDLFPGSPAIQVFYKAARGSVQGKVNDALSAVFLIPEQVTTIGVGRMAQAKPDGTFEIPGVAPGSYIIAALSGVDFRKIMDSAVLAKVAATGTRVRVEQSTVAGIELGATPWLQ